MASKEVEAQEALWARSILEMVAAGATIGKAAESLGITSRSTAERLYHKELRSYYDDNATLRQELVGRELMTLELMQRRVMRDALAGDTKAVDRVLAIMDRRSKYLGLDQAAKVDVSVTSVDAAINKVVDIIDGAIVATAPIRRIA
jgi:hypothetical protein